MTSHHLEFVTDLNSFYEQNKLLFERFAPQKGVSKTREDIHQHLKKLDLIKDENIKCVEKRNFILGLWRRGNIKNENDLDQYLRRLCNNNIIKKLNRKKPFRYMTTNEYDKNFQELRRIEYIERWDIKEQSKIFPVRIEGYYCDASIYGLLENQFNEDEIKKIGINLKNIRENLIEILKLKNQKTHDFFDMMDGKKREKLTSVDFFFHGSKI
jgi:hypothetical protein